MKEAEFFNQMEQKAEQYANNTVAEPEKHIDAVCCVKSDFMEGVYAAWELLNKPSFLKK